MDNREHITEQTLEFLKSIKSLDDVKEHKKEIFDAVIEMIKSALEILKSFFEKSLSLSQEEKVEKFSKFQDDNFLFTKEVEDELDRIYNLPGADEYMDGFQAELEEQLGPYMEEITQQMAKLAEELFGDLIGGMAEGLAQGLGTMFGGDEGEEDISPEPRDNEKLDVGQVIYDIQSLEDLKNNENKIIEQIEDQLNADLYVLEYHKNINLPNDNLIQAGHMRIEKRVKLLERELDREFERIGALPDAGDFASAAKERIIKRLEPLRKQINDLLKELKTEN